LEDILNNLWEIEFKAGRRVFHINVNKVEFEVGDYVIVAAERGEDMGKVIREYLPTVNLKYAPTAVLRKATDDDMGRLNFNREKEEESFGECQNLIDKHDLDMKLVDVEYQFDCNKLTFYFTADQRVDFRELVKDLAAIYKTRIELRQIGVRDEARRIGGFGICGLKQCCSCWLREFEPITTQLAREQNLALNPQKISGNCGRLLCCLLYEQNHYQQALTEFPQLGSVYRTEKGTATVEKVNVFTREMIVKHPDNYEEKVKVEENVTDKYGYRTTYRRVVNINGGDESESA
jgi:cell fate regulator YaaT (PSP1 superfamily)